MRLGTFFPAVAVAFRPVLLRPICCHSRTAFTRRKMSPAKARRTPTSSTTGRQERDRRRPGRMHDQEGDEDGQRLHFHGPVPGHPERRQDRRWNDGPHHSKLDGVRDVRNLVSLLREQSGVLRQSGRRLSTRCGHWAGPREPRRGDLLLLTKADVLLRRKCAVNATAYRQADGRDHAPQFDLWTAVYFAIVGASTRSVLHRPGQCRADALAQANVLLNEQIEKRAKAEDQLRQSQKMQALGQLTGGSPTTSITSSL